MSKCINKINKSNDKIIRKRVGDIVNLKYGKIRKEVRKGDVYHHEFCLHVDSFHFTQTTKAVLSLINEFMERYAFLRLYLKDVDQTKGQGVKLCVDIEWTDYMNVIERIDLDPRGELAQTIRNMNEKNTKLFENALRTQISKAKLASSFTKGITEQKIFLAKGTMHHPITRIHFQKLMTGFARKYPFVEIRYDRSNVAFLRVFWSNYYEQPNQGAEQIDTGLLIRDHGVRRHGVGLEIERSYYHPHQHQHHLSSSQIETARQYYPQNQPVAVQPQYFPPSPSAPPIVVQAAPSLHRNYQAHVEMAPQIQHVDNRRVQMEYPSVPQHQVETSPPPPPPAYGNTMYPNLPESAEEHHHHHHHKRSFKSILKKPSRSSYIKVGGEEPLLA